MGLQASSGTLTGLETCQQDTSPRSTVLRFLEKPQDGASLPEMTEQAGSLRRGLSVSRETDERAVNGFQKLDSYSEPVLGRTGWRPRGRHPAPTRRAA